MTAVLEFDAVDHRYFLDGEEVPGVTRLLNPLQDFGGASLETLTRKAALGTAIHRAAELDDIGDLDEDSVDPAIAPYLAAWRRFREETRAEFHAIEEQLCHPQLRFAGTIDRVATLHLRDRPRAMWLLDLKSSLHVEPWVGVQLAGYRMLLEADGRRVDAVGAVQLFPDGRYRLHEFGHPDHARCFTGLLAVHHWRRKHV